MAQFIVKDSRLPIFVKQVPVASGTVAGTFVIQGNKFGLAGFNAKPSQDGTTFYVTVDTAAHIRFTGIAIAFTDGQTVYWNAGAVSATTGTKIGYAERAKGAAAGDLHVQLVPVAA